MPEGCFLSPFLQRRSEPTHVPLSRSSAPAEPTSKGHCQKWHNETEGLEDTCM